MTRYQFIIAGSILTLSVAACQDFLTATHSQLVPPPTVGRSFMSAPPVSINVPVDTGRWLIVNWPYREGVQVERVWTGLTHVTSDPRNAPLIRGYSGDVDYKGVFVDGVWQYCALHASVKSRGTVYPNAQACPATNPTVIDPFVDTTIVGDSIFAIRGPHVPESPGQCYPSAQCYTYGGNQTITLTPLSADLDVRGSYGGRVGRAVFVPSFTQTPYTNVFFSDSSFPRERPFQALTWGWHKIDPLATPNPVYHSTDINECPTRNLPFYTNNLCSLNVKESGVLTSDVRVNGVTHTDSVTVECAEDSILDNANIRADLVAALRAGDNPDKQLRRERGGWIFQDTATHAYFTQSDTLANAAATDCNIVPTNMIAPGAFSVGYYHTHEGQAPDVAWGCKDKNGRPFNHKVEIDPSANGGGSDSDWGMTRQGWPQYIISLHGETFRLNVNSDSLTTAQKEANPNHWAWKNGLCAWAAGR